MRLTLSQTGWWATPPFLQISQFRITANVNKVTLTNVAHDVTIQIMDSVKVALFNDLYDKSTFCHSITTSPYALFITLDL
jgi:hypothetical protein